jgi:hypothetical protein
MSATAHPIALPRTRAVKWRWSLAARWSESQCAGRVGSSCWVASSPSSRPGGSAGTSAIAKRRQSDRTVELRPRGRPKNRQRRRLPPIRSAPPPRTRNRRASAVPHQWRRPKRSRARRIQPGRERASIEARQRRAPSEQRAGGRARRAALERGGAHFFDRRRMGSAFRRTGARMRTPIGVRAASARNPPRDRP